MKRWSFRIVVLATAVLIGSTAAVRASDLAISPTTITLTNEPAQDVVVTNTGNGLVRLSVRAYAWSQNADDPEKLVESDKVVYFPEIFVLPPGATQRIRVGVAGRPTDKEQTYRLIIQELPSNPIPGPNGAGVSFVGRIDMPVFVAPGDSIRPTRIPKLASLRVERGVAQAVLANEGNVHISQSTIRFTGVNRQGRVIWTDTKQPFYILANGTQTARASIPRSICSQLESVTVRWSLRDNLGVLTSSAKATSCSSRGP